MNRINETSICQHTPFPVTEANYQFSLLMDKKPTIAELWCSKKICVSCGHEIIISYQLIIYYLLIAYFLPSLIISPSLILASSIIEDMTLWKGWLLIATVLSGLFCTAKVFHERIPYWLYSHLPWIPVEQAILSVGRFRLNIRKKLHCYFLQGAAYLLGVLPVLGVLHLLR